MGTVLMQQNGIMRSIQMQNSSKSEKEEQNTDLMLECYRDKIKLITNQISELEGKKQQLQSLIDKLVG